ncbi:MAG: DHH family phosphoesterase [Caldicoprobacterales bacterium]
MKRFKIKENMAVDIKIMLGIILLLSLILIYYEWIIGILALTLSSAIIFFNLKAQKRRSRQMIQRLENLSFSIDLATKSAILTVPMPVVVTQKDGTIIWYNKYFNEIIKDKEIVGSSLEEILPQLDLNLLQQEERGLEPVKINDKIYTITCSPVDIDKELDESRRILVLYWKDITDKTVFEEKYKKGQLVLAHIYVDNYDEVLSNTDEADRPMVVAEIEGRLGKWAMSLNAGLQKYERDKFLMIMDTEILEMLEAKKFDILDNIREIDMGNQMNPTLSIGVGAEASSPLQSSNYAKTALDMALGRGGDQVVVKKGSKLYFYGGKTKAVERRTKVKSRVIAGVLRELMEQSRDVYIMSHELPDLDSMGSALGIYRCARYIDVEAYIVLDESNPSIHYLMKEIEKREEYENLFISPREAVSRVDPTSSLLIVVDTHRPSFTIAPELIDIAERIVVIDHHRRSAESIENAILTYLEPYASSASELVSEIVQYFDEKLKLNPLEADALLSGITMDTKSFTFKTGVRTFEAASYLKRSGADPTSARQFFRDDIETYIARAETVKNAFIIRDSIAVSQCPPGVKNSSLIAAQAADNLLTIRGISASFVLAQVDDGVIISGRSLGNINVQLILEKLGGGGHMTIAGAQLDDITIEEARERVINAVEEYLSEEGESK